MNPLIQYFDVLDDPRDVRGKKYKLTDLLIMTIYGILNGHTDFTSHEEEKGIERDEKVEIILSAAKIPLLRISNAHLNDKVFIESVVEEKLKELNLTKIL